MATEGKIVTLLNDDKTMGIFPKTKISAVSDNDGKGLDAVISELKESIENLDVPVKSVNGKTGNVVLNASDVGATTETWVKAQIDDLKAVGIQQTPLYPEEGATVEEQLAWLKTNGDKAKMYLLADGFLYAYMTVTATGEDVEATYTNVLPLATDSDRKTIYQGKGFIDDYRLSSSGSLSEQVGMKASGFISAKEGDILRIKGIKGMTGVSSYVISYNSSNTKVNYKNFAQNAGDNEFITPNAGYMTVENEIVIFPLVSTYFGTGFNAIRFSGVFDENTIVTINEEITEGGSGYTNVLLTAINADGTPYVGNNGEKGYKTDYRLNSSRNEVAATGRCCTGFIPVKSTDTVRIKNIKNPSDMNGYIHFYESDFSSNAGIMYEPQWGDLFTFRPTDSQSINSVNMAVTSKCAYMRISTGTIDDTTIITINEEIVDTPAVPPTTTTQKWASTGHAFIPNENYDDIVAELQRVTTSHTQELSYLRKQIENGTEPETSDNLSLIKNWDMPIYDAHIPVFELSAEKAGKTGLTNTPDMIYALYDALMAKHPDYISKTDLGLCSDGVNHVYRYDFKQREPRHESVVWSETKTKAILMSGVHFEWAGIYSLYYALEEIAENPELFDLRRNTHFIVVPVSNPFCTIVDNYEASIGVLNANGVQIHRNFEVDFLYPTDGDYIEAGQRNHGGTAPLSEVETQYIDNIMKNNTDSAFFMTCHNFDSDGQWGVNFIWSSTATKFMCNMGFRLVDKMSNAWIKTHPELIDGIKSLKTDNVADGDYRLGFAGISTSAGTETKQATKYGIQATNVEVCARFLAHGTASSAEPSMSAFTLSRGAETYINFLLMACGLYDYKDKKEYFKN